MRRLLPLLLLLAVPLPARAQLPMNIPDVCSGSPDNVANGATLTISSTTTKNCLGIHGTVVVSSTLNINTIIVYSDGFLDLQPGANVVFRDTAVNLGADPRQWSQGLIVIGRFRSLGTEKTAFRRMTAEVVAGATTVTLTSAPTNWQVGDEIFFPDSRATDENNLFNANFALRHEIRTITNVSSATVTFTPALTYDHRGARNANGSVNSSFVPHVANLTRNITIRSANPSGTRGHTVYTDRANIEIRNTVFRDLGRTTTDIVVDADSAANQIGRYPLHVHMLMGPVNPGNTGYQFQVTGNVVRDSRKWPIAIHASSYGLVENNVVIGGSQLTGAGIAMENGAETENMIRGNFVGDIRGNINARETGTGAPSSGQTPGSGGECIWAGGFNNRFVNNVVTGCRNPAQQIVAGVGFKFFMPAPPAGTVVQQPPFRGAAANELVSVVGQNQKILEFDGNEAYGLMADGLTIWQLGTDGYAWNQSQPETLIKDFKVWHAYESGVWLYPSNHVTIQNLQYRVDPNARPYCLNAIMGGDYRQVNLKITGGDIHACSVMSSTMDPVDTFIIEDVVATTREHAFKFQTPATPGTGAGRPAMGVTVSVIDPVITPWPGFSLRTIQMDHRTDIGNSHTSQPYIVNVTEGVTTFRVCFAEQATQNLYGGICGSVSTRADIDGIISGTAPPTPPDPPDPPDPPPTDPPPAEVCGNGVDDDRDGSIDEGCTPTTPPPPVENPPPGPFVLPALVIQGADAVVSGVETTWNASSTTAFSFPFNPNQATYGLTPAFANTPSGTYALAFRIDAAALAALAQASSMALLSFRPEPDINQLEFPVRGLEIFRVEPTDVVIRAAEGRQNQVVHASSPPITTLASTTTAIVTFTPSSFSLWVNGVLVDTRARTPSTSTQLRLYLAAAPHLAHNSDHQFLDGVTRTPVVYDRVLSGGEIADLHAALIAGVPDPDPPSPPDPPPASPTITVSPTSVSWAFTPGQAAPSAVPITVTVSSGVPWSSSESAAFFDGTPLCASPGTCASGATTSVTPASGFFSTLTTPGTYTSTMTISAAGVTPAKTIPVTLVVSPAPPIPPPNPGSLTAPTLTATTCTVTVVGTPPDGGGWRVQYFDGTASITGVSNRYTRPVTLTRGFHSITARWTKTGQSPQTSPAATYTCD